MGVSIPQVVTEDRASGALVIDGSLRFDKNNNQYLKFTPTATGNRRTWTFSCWFRKMEESANRVIFSSYGSSPWTAIQTTGNNDGRIQATFDAGITSGYYTNARYRDTGWYHLVWAVDTTQPGDPNKSKLYINGELQTYGANAHPSLNEETPFNLASRTMYIGYTPNQLFDGHMSQCYFLDGLAVGPGYFGYTDPLTGTWRPKKFRAEGTTVNNGTNWSAGLTGTADGSGAIGLMFDGDTTDGSWSNSSGYSVAFPNGGVTATNNIKIYGGSGSANWYVYLNGTKTTINAPNTGGNSPEWSATGVTGYVDLGPGTLTSIGTEGAGIAQNGEVSGIEIDGVLMRDSTTQNLQFGTNGFYLPMDGNSPIGKDMSGEGHDWTPVNFGGSAALDKATGAKPILNTVNGGNISRPGVFGSKVSSTIAVTVSNATGNNKYYFDSVLNPTLALIRGATITFDTTDSSNNSHPFKLSSTNADSSGGTEYTDGVKYYINGSSVSGSDYVSNYANNGGGTGFRGIKWTIPHNVSTTYYYCTQHNGMGNNGRLNSTTDETKADPYAWKCVYAMPLIDKNDVSNQVNCTTTTKGTTDTGSSADAASSAFYGQSRNFDSSNDTIYTTANSADFQFGSGDFTIEAWVLNEGGTADSIVSCWNYPANKRSWNLYLDAAKRVSLITSTNGSSQGNHPPYVDAAIIPDNKWTHVAVTKASNVYRVFVDGDLKNSETQSETLYSNTDDGVHIGSTYGATEWWNGGIQDVRVYKGVAKYTENFIPTSTNPDILPDSPSGVATKSKLKKITDGATAFDGSGDYLRVEHGDMAMGTGDFTVEAFIYNNSHVNYRNYIGTRESGQAVNEGWCIASNSGGDLYLYSNGLYTNLTTKMATKKWYHVVYTRASGTHRWIVDGVLKGTDSSSRDYTDDKLTIGANSYAGSEPLDGFVSNVRVIKGSIPTEYQTSSTTAGTQIFTTPTEPLTSTSQGANSSHVKLLCCQSNNEGPQKTAVIPSVTGTATAMWPLNSDINDDSGNSNNLSETGGSTSFTSAGTNPFGLSNCADFAADGKYLSYAVNPASAWTIDGYVKFDDVSSGHNSYVLGWDGTNGAKTCMGLIKSNSTFGVWGSSNLNTTTVAETGKWYHIRITSSGATDLALYVNGVLAGRSTSSDGSPGTPITIGDMQSGRFDGQIAGVRYTPTDLGAPPLGGETTSSGVTSNSPSVGVTLAGDVAATAFNPFNTNINTVRGQESGYATLNPLNKHNSNNTLTEGNLKFTSSGNDGTLTESTIAMSSGKFYFEVVYSGGQGTGQLAGIRKPGARNYNDSYIYVGTGNKYTNGGSSASYGAGLVNGDVIGTAYDADSGTLEFFKNGVSQGIAFTGITGTYAFFVGSFGSTPTGVANFGQKPFKFPPPDGFQPLTSSTVRPDTIISRPDQYFKATLYTGNTDSSQDIDVGFAPDLVWQKIRGQAGDHALTDTVRGISGGYLQTEDTDPQKGNANDGISAFLPNGFRAFNSFNNNGLNWVSWCWKAGGSSNTFNIDDVGYANASDVNMSVGSLNSSLYNQSQTWSNSLTVSGSWDSGGVTPANAFDGSLSTNARSMGQNEQITFDITSTPLTFTDKVELYHTSSGMDVSVNGGTVQVPATNQFVTIASGGGTLNRITFVNANAKTVVTALRVDGKLLVDPNAITTPSIAATGCSVGTKQGFSIVKYTGSGSAGSLAHGLGQKPTFWILKAIDSATYPNWYAYTEQIDGSLDFMHLNTNEHKFDSAAAAPTSTTIGVTQTLSEVGLSWIAYMWHDVPGLQKFGSFTGNSSNNFVELGFRPAMVWVKRAIANSSADTTTNNSAWTIMDSARLSYNGLTPNHLYANWNVGEGKRGNSTSTSTLVDMTLEPHSNGFYLNGPATETNSDTGSFIYCAWAEAPTFNLYGATSNAR